MEWWHWVLIGVGLWCLVSIPAARIIAKGLPKTPTEEDVIAQEVQEANRRDQRNSGNGYDS